MNKIIALPVILLLVACQPNKKVDFVKKKFVNECIIPHTSVRSQGQTQSCWAYTMASMMESERILTHNDTIRISVMYYMREKYLNHFINHYYTKSKDKVRGGSLGHTFLQLYKEIGAIPNEVYTGLRNGSIRHDHSKLVKELQKLADKAVKSKNLALYKEKAEKLLDETLGEVPETFVYNGITYTAKSFADSVGLNPSNYIELTSFSHHPFYKWFVLEVPDNWEHAVFYNLPIDEMEIIVREALSKGRTIAWDGDIHEAGFITGNGIATYHKTSVSQAERQKGFDTFETTDDHMMHIIGTANDEDGKFFYILKNSWGKYGPYKGLVYMSEDYFRAKTISVVVPKEYVAYSNLPN